YGKGPGGEKRRSVGGGGFLKKKNWTWVRGWRQRASVRRNSATAGSSWTVDLSRTLSPCASQARHHRGWADASASATAGARWSDESRRTEPGPGGVPVLELPRESSVREAHAGGDAVGLPCRGVGVGAVRRASRGAQVVVFFFSSRRRHTRLVSDWSSDVCSSD